MTLLSPWSALIAAALAVPALLLLYFLKLRRQRLRIPSTLLWQKSFEDLQVNAPFQRLKWSMLLALQLLLLAAMLLALAEPVMKGSGVGDSQIVLLIDRSASMNARIETDADAAKRNGGRTSEPPRTRLDAAKSAAREMIDQLGRAGNQGQMMIIAFGRSARVVTTYQSDRSLLLGAINSIEPTDEEGDLDAALQLAGAYAGTRDESENQSPPAVVLLSDGGSGGEQAAQSNGDGKQEHLLRAGRFRFVQIAPESTEPSISDNVGITAIGGRRDFENPSQVLSFARIINTAPQPEQVNVTLMIDDQPAATIRKSIPAATDKGPGEASVTHAVDLPGGGGAVLTLRLNRNDALPEDDTAAIVMPAPTRPRIALVHPNDSQPDQFLRSLLEAMEPQRLDVIAFDAYQANESQVADVSERGGNSGHNLIVFDRVSAARLPGVPSLTFGGVPAPLKATDSTATAEQGNRVLSWDRQHPIMRNVSLDTILYAGFGAYELPAGATALAYGSQGPIMTTLRTRGERHVVVGFALVQSNWPLHVSFAVFLQNAVEYLTLAESGQNGLAFKPGEPISVRVRVRADARTIQIRGPVEAQIPVEGGARTTLPPLRRAGLYEVDGAIPPFDQVAVSVLSDAESDIRPRSDVVVNDQSVSAAATQGFSPRALWPWLVGAAFALAAIEWLAYCRKLRGSW